MSQLTLEQALQNAVRHHQAGELPQAEQLYRQILAHQPAHPMALHNLGTIALQCGKNDIGVSLIRQAIALRPDAPEPLNTLGTALQNIGAVHEAITAFRQALALRPDYPEAYYNLGNALKDDGKLHEAIAAYRHALAIRPSFVEAHTNLGNALTIVGELDEAILAYRHAVSLRPDYCQGYYNLGNALKDSGQLVEAITACSKAIALQPNYAEARCILGNALKDKGRTDEALTAYRQAIALKSDFAEAYGNFGIALREIGQISEAIAAYRQALTLKPDYADAHCNLGIALRELRQPAQAVDAFRQAIALQSDHAEAYSNLGVVLRDLGCMDEAIVAFQHAISFKGNLPEAHHNLALALLLRGDFAAGWAEYEWRWKCANFPSPRRHFSQPQWDGSDVTNGTLLLHYEQGLGDTIQFVRYLPRVAERCDKIIVMCQSELQRMLQGNYGIAQWITPGGPLPPFDFHCPLLSLPNAFGTTLQTVPGSVPYLGADSSAIELWRQRFGDGHTGLKVGLAWAGSTAHANDRNRSLSLSSLAPMLQVPDISFCSLQKGGQATESRNLPEGIDFVDWADDLHDFSDTAALIANLDLIITVDTAVAHLAGAMGKPVWLLLPFVPDWRWMLDRDDSPWYPTMRLFRQRAIGQWEEVIARVTKCLAELSESPEHQVYDQANALKSDDAGAHFGLGNSLCNQGELDMAIAAYRRAISLRPNFPEAHSNLGNALRGKGHLDEAIAAYRHAIALRSDFGDAYGNLGVALKEVGQLDEAIAVCRQAVALKPGSPECHYNLGTALYAQGHLHEALSAYQHAVILRPDFAEANTNIGLTMLLQGKFSAGWSASEWRWRCQDFRRSRPNFSQPQWDGSESASSTVLLLAEQGFGDTIQFIRYLPMVARRCGKVIVRCQSELKRLLRPMPDVAQWITPGEPLPAFDFHCPLLSLPLALSTTLHTIPNSVPYLRADSDDITKWRERLADQGDDFKVGLAWAGSSTHKDDRNRSLSLSSLIPLGQVPNVKFYSLQKGEKTTQLQGQLTGTEWVDWTRDLNDFADTAALIANLDLVITVDTAVAHLAGALGKPVWLMLPFVPDWRWMMDREDSPWYPTMRLFRQKNIGQWEEVIDRVAEALANRVRDLQPGADG